MIVGDSEIDVQTARNAGTWICGVTYGFGSHRFDEFLPILLSTVLLNWCRASRALQSGTPASALTLPRFGFCETSPRYVQAFFKSDARVVSPAHFSPERCPPANRECLLRVAGAYFALAGRPVIFSSNASVWFSGVPRAGANVDGQSRGAFRFAGQQICFDHISYVREVARLLSISVNSGLRSIQYSRIEQRQHAGIR